MIVLLPVQKNYCDVLSHFDTTSLHSSPDLTKFTRYTLESEIKELPNLEEYVLLLSV